MNKITRFRWCNLRGCLIALALALPAGPSALAGDAPASFPVTIRVDAAKSKGELQPIWRFFGYDELNYTTMKDGKKLLAELGKLGSHTVFIRAHNLLNTGDGSPALKWSSTNVYTEDADGKPVYDWTIVDRIFDTYLACGVKPFVELGFMPEALSSHPEDYPRNLRPNQTAPVGRGQSYPPNDYTKWGNLCYELAKHCLARYGREEVEQWWWEVWNEPNISFFRGTPQEYHKLYDFGIDGVRRALPTARVGGPHTAGGPGGRFLRDFLEHCLRGKNYATGEVGSPLDFIAFHAKGNPRFVDGHVRMNMSPQLSNIDGGFAAVAAFPELKDKPIIIGESDPEGGAARRAPELGYRPGTLYASYTAASFARKYDLADKHGVNFRGALTWAFEFEDQPYFAGFRVLATNGIDLPVLNVFRMFGKMGGRRLAVESSADTGVEAILAKGVRGTPDVAALASLDAPQKRLCVMVWHYHDDDVPGPAADVALTLTGLPIAAGASRVEHFRIDENHSNAYTVWQRMGSPQEPSPETYAELEQAGQLAALGPAETVRIEDSGATLRFALPRQAVSLLVLEWE